MESLVCVSPSRQLTYIFQSKTRGVSFLSKFHGTQFETVKAKQCPHCSFLIFPKMKGAYTSDWCPSCGYNIELVSTGVNKNSFPIVKVKVSPSGEVVAIF